MARNHTPHPREIAARAVKVRGLVIALEAFGLHRGAVVTADELTTWTENSWSLLSMIAGVIKPSETSQAAVIAELRTQERRAS